MTRYTADSNVHTLNIFDIDDTLFHTFAKIKVLKNGDVIKELSNSEFNNYVLSEGESFDFNEFRSAKLFNQTSRPIQRMLDHAKHLIHHKENSRTILLTARSDFDNRELFLETFREHGFPIDEVHVERAGNLEQFNPTYSSAVAKMCIIRKYLATGRYSHIRVYDDSEKNLRGILKLIQLHPAIRIEAFMVHHDGSFTEYKY